MMEKEFVDPLFQTYNGEDGMDFMGNDHFPDRIKIINILKSFLEVFFPGYLGENINKKNLRNFLENRLKEISEDLFEQIKLTLKYQNHDQPDETAQKVTKQILSRMPAIRQALKADLIATYQGDPAANSLEEIAASYPGILAISIYRIAHEFYNQDIPFFPRIMSEYAHGRTGIDINPGAKIGDHFFIDHGTGIVIGETTIIGNNVKIYQGVTLGALSPAKGQCLRKEKRHPTIEDNVTIYAAATILGNITIGKGSIIGGNVWIKDPIPEETIVMIPNVKLIQKTRKH